MLEVNHIEVDRSFEGFRKLVVQLLVDHTWATLEANHTQELIKDILMVTQMFVTNSLQLLKANINLVNQKLVADRIAVATFNLALAAQDLINQILAGHHKQEVNQIKFIRVMVDLEKAFTEAQLDNQAYQLVSPMLAFLTLAYLIHIKATLVWLSSSKLAVIMKSFALNLPSSQLLQLPFRYEPFSLPFKKSL